MRNYLLSGLCICALALTGLSQASNSQHAVRHKNTSRIGNDLARLYDQTVHPANRLQPGQRLNMAHNGGLTAANPMTVVNGMVVIDAVANGDTNALLADLQQMGLTHVAVSGHVISGAIPIAELDNLAASANLQFARPAAAMTRDEDDGDDDNPKQGIAVSQGDAAQRSDLARQEEDVKGNKVRVGVLSDSYDCLGTAAADIASRDLPKAKDINIIDDTACPGTDEGRAMMQIVHDVAPKAKLAFHTAFNGQADMAGGIVELAQAGSKVIVDDVIYFAEPMFQDGIIAQAADTARSMGAAYFSSAGNNARDAFEDSFRSSGIAGVFGGDRHDFDPGPGVDDLQTVILGTGTTIFSFQWDQPYASVSGAPGSASDMDMILYFGGNFIGLGGFSINVGGDPIEVFGVSNGGPPVAVEFGLELFSGPQPGHMKYVFFGPAAVAEFATNSGSLFGHPNAAGAEAVGASAWFNTEVFNTFCIPACLNGFSSAGTTPILFDLAGNRIAPVVRLKPEIVAPDGGDTTFFGFPLSFPVPGSDEPNAFPNFFGTSAAAPHAAGVAALMIDENKKITPDQIFQALQDTALDMDDPATAGFDTGFDTGTGYGFINALDAVVAADEFDDDDDDDD